MRLIPINFNHSEAVYDLRAQSVQLGKSNAVWATDRSGKNAIWTKWKSPFEEFVGAKTNIIYVYGFYAVQQVANISEC